MLHDVPTALSIYSLGHYVRGRELMTCCVSIDFINFVPFFAITWLAPLLHPPTDRRQRCCHWLWHQSWFVCMCMSTAESSLPINDAIWLFPDIVQFINILAPHARVHECRSKTQKYETFFSIAFSLTMIVEADELSKVPWKERGGPAWWINSAGHWLRS